MKNLKRLLFLLIIAFIPFLLVGCSQEEKLEKALDELEIGNYTMDGEIVIDIDATYQGQSINQTQKAKYVIESEKSKSLTKMTINNISQIMFSKMEDNKVKVYQKQGIYWTLSETMSLEEYEDEYDDFSEVYDIDVENNFQLIDDEWVGDGEKITAMLDDYLDKLAEESLGAGADLGNLKIDEYKIKMVDNKIDSISMVMSVSTTMQGIKMEMTMTMKMNFSKIGETKVEEPTSLPE